MRGNVEGDIVRGQGKNLPEDTADFVPFASLMAVDFVQVTKGFGKPMVWLANYR